MTDRAFPIATMRFEIDSNTPDRKSQRLPNGAETDGQTEHCLGGQSIVPINIKP